MPKTTWSHLVNKAKHKTLNLAQLNLYPQFSLAIPEKIEAFLVTSVFFG